MSRKKDEFIDDGRVVADMNVEGMPWNNGYNRFLGGLSPRGLLKKKRAESAKREEVQATETEVQKLLREQQEQLTKAESRSIMFSALLAGLLIGGIFIAAAALFILFCTNVWFA